MPATPTATSTVPTRQARPKLSLIMTADLLAGAGAESRANPARRTVGVFGQQRHLLEPDIGLIDAGIGADKAMMSFDDQRPAAGANDFAALAENYFDQLGFFTEFARQLARPRRRRTVASAIIWPSALETIFCATTRTSSSASRPLLPLRRPRKSAGRRSRRRATSPIPSTPISSNRFITRRSGAPAPRSVAPTCAGNPRSTRRRDTIGKKSFEILRLVDIQSDMLVLEKAQRQSLGGYLAHMKSETVMTEAQLDDIRRRQQQSIGAKPIVRRHQ